MNGTKDKSKGGPIGIIAVVVVLIIVGVGAAVLLDRTMSKRSGRSVDQSQPGKVVNPATRLVEAPPPLPPDPPQIVEEPVEDPVVEPGNESDKTKKKPLPTGTIDKAAAQAVTSKNYARVRACYEKQLKVNNFLTGSIVVKIVVYPDGSVNAVRFMEDTIRNTIMNSCIKSEIMGWTFPKPEGGKVEIQQSYRFEPKAG